MSVETLLIWLVVGAIAGWLASTIVRGGGMGLVADIVVGIVGAFIGGWLLPQVGLVIGGGIIGVIATATIGAIILLLIVRLIKRA
ncbi:MAG: GlsB/YeaQ/YmgE family stress response membrane protein [Alphaproteobacteria bacterium]